MTKHFIIITILISSLILISKTLSYSQNIEEKGIEEKGQVSLSFGKTQSKRKISRFRNITEGQIVREGDIIRTYENGLIEIILFNNKRFKLYNNTAILIEQITKTNINILLYNGTISINEELSKDFIYNIRNRHFSILSEVIQKEEQKEIEYKETNYYIEYKDNITNITLTKGDMKIKENIESIENIEEQNKKIIEISAPAIISLNNAQPITNAKIDYKEDNVEEQAEEIDDSFEEEADIENFDPEYKTPITDDDLFYKNRRKKTNRKAIVKKYRKRKQIYYNIKLGAFNWIDNEFYSSLGFYPEFRISTFTLRLRLLLYVPYLNIENIDKYYNIQEWYFKKATDYINKIDIVEYTNKDKSFYIRLSELHRKTRGFGLTVKDYTNTILLPKQRLPAFDFGLNFPVIDIEGFSSNITNFNIMSFRIASRPFIEENKENYSDHYSIAINFSTDLEPNDISTNPLILLGSIDINIPVLRDINSDYQLSLYSEASIQGFEFNNQTAADKYGEEANKLTFIDNFGIRVGINGMLFKHFVYKLQYSYLQKGFIPEYIDAFYEIERENKMKLLLADNKEDAHGILIGLGARLPEYIEVYTEFYYETGNIPNLIKTNNKFKLEIKTSSDLSPIFSGELIYIRKNISSFENFFLQILDNSLLYFQIKAAATKWMDVKAGYKHFVEKENNNFKNFVYINLLFIL